MNIKTASCVFFLCALFVSCKNGPIRSGIIDDTIFESDINRGKSMLQVRTTLAFSDGSSAHDCRTYLKSFSRNELLETINNKAIKSEYLVCDALNVFSESRGYNGDVDKDQIGVDLLKKLDIRSFPNSLAIAAKTDSYTLDRIFPSRSYSNGASAVYESDDWLFTLRVIAVLKINNNSQPDWLVQLFDESKSGNYRDYATLVIYDPNNSGMFKATPYPLKGH